MGMEELHDGAEKFDPRTETAFKFLQMFSACCVMFAHGYGEVGYMAGAWVPVLVSAAVMRLHFPSCW